MHESEKWKGSRSVVSDSSWVWTTAYQAPPSTGFSRQEYWNGVPLPSPKYQESFLNCCNFSNWNYWVHCNRWFTFSKSALYNMWQQVIQRSHETFKTASPHEDLAPCIKRRAFGVFQKKKVNTKNRSNYWRPPLSQMCLHWQHLKILHAVTKIEDPEDHN